MHRNLVYYCLLAPHIYIFVLRAHPVHGESHNQRNATGEIATVAAQNCLKSSRDKFGMYDLRS